MKQLKTEHPLLFKPEMVIATLEDRKTTTRRLNGLEEVNENPDAWTLGRVGDLSWKVKKQYQGRFGAMFQSELIEPRTISLCPQLCPYGRPGDTLWVRETWWHEQGLDFENAAFMDGTIISKTGLKTFVPNWAPTYATWKKRPGIHMFRWASRITLKITNIRVQRLQDMLPIDAVSEGAYVPPKVKWGHAEGPLAIAQFANLWDTINPKMNWEFNPWVWVIDFERVK